MSILGSGHTDLEPQPHEDYGRLEIDLSTARTNEEINIQGNYIAKIKYDGTDTGCYFKIDHRHSAKIYAKEFKLIKRRYARLFLTNTAQVGKVLTIQINELDVSIIEPDIPAMDAGTLGNIETAIEALAVFQAIDGAGDLQKIKEELEKVNTDLAAIELIQDVLLNALHTDDTTFSPGLSTVMAIGAEFDDTTPDSVDEGDAGAVRMSGNRNLYTMIRDGQMNERSVRVNAAYELLSHDADLLAALAIGQGGELQAIKDQMITDNAVLDSILLDTAKLTAWNIANNCKTKEQYDGDTFRAAITTTTTPQRVSANSKMLAELVIKNTSATRGILVGNAATQDFPLAAGESLSLKNINAYGVHLLWDGAGAAVKCIGSQRDA